MKQSITADKTNSKTINKIQCNNVHSFPTINDTSLTTVFNLPSHLLEENLWEGNLKLYRVKNMFVKTACSIEAVHLAMSPLFCLVHTLSYHGCLYLHIKSWNTPRLSFNLILKYNNVFILLLVGKLGPTGTRAIHSQAGKQLDPIWLLAKSFSLYCRHWWSP